LCRIIALQAAIYVAGPIDCAAWHTGLLGLVSPQAGSNGGLIHH
jgi:hypothetical protein